VEYLKRGIIAKETSDTVTAVVYLKYNDPDLTLNNIMGSFFKQLLSSCQAIPEAVVAIYEASEQFNSQMPLNVISKLGLAVV
jgi:hypothetical protein